MKMPDPSRIVMGRIQLQDLVVSRTGESKNIYCTDNYFQNIRQTGFNAIVISCGGFDGRFINQPGEESKVGQPVTGYNHIHRAVSDAHHHDLTVILEFEVQSRNGETFLDRPATSDWLGRVDALLKNNQTIYEADGIWLSDAPGVASRKQYDEGASEVRTVGLPDLHTFAARYPSTLLVVDLDLAETPLTETPTCRAPNLIFCNSVPGSLLSDWRQQGSASVVNMDELAAALNYSEAERHEDAGFDGTDVDNSHFPGAIISDAAVSEHPLRVSQSNELDRVFAAVILTAPGIPVLSSTDDLSHLAGLLELRQDRPGISGGLRGSHIRIIHKNDTGKVLAYLRWNQDARQDGVIVLLNFNGEGWRDYTLGLPMDSNWQVQLYDEATDDERQSFQFSEEEYFPEPASLTLDLAPYSYLILTRTN